MTDILVIYGAPAVGKTTLVIYLREHFSLEVLELDEEIMKENNGVWPEPPEYRNSVVVPKVMERISGLNKMLFVTSGLSEEFVKKIQEKNGEVALLYLSEKELLARNAIRVREEGQKNVYNQIKWNLADQRRLKKNITFDCVLDASQTVSQIAEEVLHIMKD